MILAQHLRNTSPWLSEFGRLFDSAFRHLDTAPNDLRVFEDDNGWTLELDFPGVPREDLELEVKEGALHLRVKDRSTYRLPVGKQVDASGIGARLELGVLRVRLPKVAASVETKRIEIL